MSVFKYFAVGLLLALSSLTQANESAAVSGADLYAANQQIVTKAEVDDAFAVANHVIINHTVTGSAHLAGTHVEINAPIQQSLYAFGDSVIIGNHVQQDTLTIGRNLLINGDINGDLRAMGETISVNGIINGHANLAGNHIHINNHIQGDLSVATAQVSFGSDALVDGDINIYSDYADTMEIPSHVAPSGRIHRHLDDLDGHMEMGSWRGEVHASGWQYWLGSTLTSFVLCLILVLIARQFVHRAANSISQTTASNLTQGTLALALLIGAILLSAITIIGLPVSLLLILATIVAVFIASLVGSYSLGYMIWVRWRHEEPNGFRALAMTALLGTLVLSLLEAIPFIGWLIGILVMLAGLGAINPWRTTRGT